MSVSSRFNAFLERNMPSGLYPRALLILFIPVLLLQIVMFGVLLERYHDNVTRVFGRSMARQAGFVMQQYESGAQSPDAFAALSNDVARRLRMDISLSPGPIPSQPEFPFYAFFENRLVRYLGDQTSQPFLVEPGTADDKVSFRIQMSNGEVMRFRFSADRLGLGDTTTILALLVASSLVFLGIATIFLRNQIRPIQDLAKAAKAFGMGQTQVALRPRGAAEVKDAGLAFLDMRQRLGRHVEQRTAMLAGVSHDLRTILTRFKLELAVLGDNPKVHPLKEDVDEMQHMLEDYMAFVKGDGGEEATDCDLSALIAATLESVERDRPDSDAVIHVGDLPAGSVKLKANAFRRLLTNLVSNAVRYGRTVKVSAQLQDSRLRVFVDDDGPGIPVERREDAFRPFVRLDNARNLDETGTGLGLAIAQDIAQAHGGEIALRDSPAGGLRAEVNLPQ